MLGKEFKIAIANIRQKKSVTVSLVIIIFLVALFLNICLTLTDVPQVIDGIHEKLNGCDLRIMLRERTDTEDTLDKFSKVDGVAEIECIKAINMGPVNVMEENNHNMEQREILKSCEKKDSSKYGICLPIAMENVGYSLGDTYVLRGIITEYTVSCEITAFARYPSMFASDDALANDNARADMNSEDFKRLLEEIREDTNGNRLKNVYNCYLLKYKDNVVQSDLIKALAKAIDRETRDMDYSRYSSMRSNTVFNLSLYSGIMMVFSILVLVVACFMVLFKMNDSIRSDMKSIGSLGAMGYSCREIRRAYALQYVIYAIAGTLAGLAVSYAATPLLHNVVLEITCVSNPYILHILPDAAAVLIIFSVMLAILFISTRKFKKYPPIVALNDGMTSHSFKKNYAPIEKTGGGLSAIFAFKNIMREKKQMALIIISVLLLTFATTTLMDIKQNLELDDFWYYTIGYENPVAGAGVKVENYESVKADAEKINGVDKAVGISYLTLKSTDEDIIMSFRAMEDFSDSKYLNCYKGEKPVRDNEVALSDDMAKTLSKNVGDKITLSFSSKGENGEENVKSQKFLITGLIQSAMQENLITMEGLDSLSENSKNKLYQVLIYSETLSYKQIENELTDMCGEANIDGKLFYIEDTGEMLDSLIDSFKIPVNAISYIMMIITFIVILFILAVVIRSALYNMRHELGIRKALGFNSAEIILSIMLTYLPVVGIGAFLGTAISILVMPPLTKLIFDEFLSVYNVNIIIYPEIIFPFAGVIVLFAMLIGFLFSLKVKRITPHELVSE